MSADKPQGRTDGARPSVLIVDDRVENLLALEALLEALPVRPVRAMSSREALERVEEEHFALILLDVQMPGTDGLEAARLIKARERGAVVPILFITAQERDRRRVTTAYEAGAVDYLFKPLDPDELRAKVSAFVDLNEMHAQDRDRRRRYADRLVLASEERYRRAAERAERALEALRVADRAKSEFLSRMSHELRTPLNAILGYVQLLDLGILGDTTPEQHVHLNRVRQSAVHLLGLVNEILDLVTLESAQLRVVREVGHLGEMCDAALALVRIEAALRHLTLVPLPVGDPGAAYLGDPNRVRQVLAHLLTNSVKFTPPGGRVILSCGTTARDSSEADVPVGGPWAYVRVTDTGPGIAPEQLAHVFDAFTQLDGGLTRAQDGAGLGLTISLRLARAMGGDVTVRSVLGEGAAFTLWLPTPDSLAERQSADDGRSAGLMSLSDNAPSDHLSRRRASEDREPPHSRVLSSGTFRQLAALGGTLAAEVDAVVTEHVARLRADPAMPDLATLPDTKLRNHLNTLVCEIAQVLRLTGETEARTPEGLRDGSEILRLVSELHGTQRERLNWSEADVAQEVTLLLAGIRAHLRDASQHASDGDALEHAALIAARLLDQSRHASLRGFRTAQRVRLP